jgi:hypothetical protein
LQDEVGGAAALLARELGRPMTAFAYPYGSLNGAVRQEVGAHHRLAFTTEMGPAMLGDDPLLIRRIDAFYLQAPAVYTRLFTTAGRAYLAGRAMARRLRGALTDGDSPAHGDPLEPGRPRPSATMHRIVARRPRGSRP